MINPLNPPKKSPDDFEDGDFRKDIARYSKENFPNILKLADGLKEIGKKYNVTAGQIALAWVLAQGEDVIPIPGTTRLPVSARLRLGQHRIAAETANFRRTSRKTWLL